MDSGKTMYSIYRNSIIKLAVSQHVKIIKKIINDYLPIRLAVISLCEQENDIINAENFLSNQTNLLYIRVLVKDNNILTLDYPITKVDYSVDIFGQSWPLVIDSIPIMSTKIKIKQNIFYIVSKEDALIDLDKKFKKLYKQMKEAVNDLEAFDNFGNPSFKTSAGEIMTMYLNELNKKI